VKIIPQIRIARPIAIILEDSSYTESKFIHDAFNSWTEKSCGTSYSFVVDCP